MLCRNTYVQCFVGAPYKSITYQIIDLSDLTFGLQMGYKKHLFAVEFIPI